MKLLRLTILSALLLMVSSSLYAAENLQFSAAVDQILLGGDSILFYKGRTAGVNYGDEYTMYLNGEAVARIVIIEVDYEYAFGKIIEAKPLYEGRLYQFKTTPPDCGLATVDIREYNYPARNALDQCNCAPPIPWTLPGCPRGVEGIISSRCNPCPLILGGKTAAAKTTSTAVTKPGAAKTKAPSAPAKESTFKKPAATASPAKSGSSGSGSSSSGSSSSKSSSEKKPSLMGGSSKSGSSDSSSSESNSAASDQPKRSKRRNPEGASK